MSDDGIVNVEEDGPEVPAVEPVAETPVDAAPAEDAPADEPAEVEAVEVAGRKYVPVAAVISERKQRQAAQEEINRLKPYADFIEKNPDLVRRPAAPPPPTSFGPAPVDPQTEALAKTLDLYTPEGKPDVGRAQMIRTMMAQTATQIAQQQMAPVHQDRNQTASARNYQLALGYKDADGRSPSPEALTEIWRSMDPAQT